MEKYIKPCRIEVVILDNSITFFISPDIMDFEEEY